VTGSDRQTQNGQALAQVAILLVVLLGFTALAIDGGRIYLERRSLQNAADAGALAGARAMCFDDPRKTYDEAKGPAAAFALPNLRNPELAVVSFPDPPNDRSMKVTVMENALPTFVARIVGLDTVTVGATATAMCGKGTTVGGLWPLSVQVDDYDALDCGEKFYVFTDDNDAKGVDCSKCNCDLPIPGGGTMQRIGPGARGYLRLFDPLEPLPGPANPDCGTNDLKYYFANSHPGPVRVCDIVPGSPGVVAAVDNSVNSRYGDRINIVLWDDGLDCPAREPLGTCPGDPYRVAGFGCIVAGIGDGKDVWRTVTFLPKDPKYQNCPKNVKVMVATKQCPCDSRNGGTSGETCGPTDVCAVSLIE
jgi:Putative Flp pilus-assembly TadE/G-like